MDFAPIVRAIKATNPDLLFIASYPPDSTGMITSLNEIGFAARLVGGGMIGLQFAAIKQKLGPMLHNVVCYDLYVPEPTMKCPGIEDLLKRYRERATSAGDGQAPATPDCWARLCARRCKCGSAARQKRPAGKRRVD